MNKRVLLPVVFFVLVGTCLVVYGEPPAPPTPPFILPMPDNSSWNVKVTMQSDSQVPKSARTLDLTITTKSGSKEQDVSVWSDGTRTEIWFVEGIRIEQPMAKGGVILTPAVPGLGTEMDDFPDLGWLNRSNYAGVEEFKSQNCYKFKQQIIIARPPTVIQYQAYISVKTRKPVAWDVGPAHFEFVSTSPATLPPLPPAFAQSLKDFRAAADSANAYARKTP